MLEIKNLYAGYGNFSVLQDVSLCCETGKITTVIGANGCGKSTLLKSAVGMTDISSGEIILNGKSVRNMHGPLRAQKISYLAQGKNIPDITVKNLVLHGRFPYLSYPRRYRPQDYVAAEKALQKMGIENLADKYLRELSGGMRQKVYIAMALCQETEVILMDEPTTYLDIDRQFKLAETMKNLANEGRTVVAVLHDIILALKISDRIAVMENGRMVCVETPEEILEKKIIPRIFHVEIVPVLCGGELEYVYRKVDES
ncbi:MAG: ABC transporter ATP-binding protein [Clostridia bacterium]|nr:ABC transporter ATP-binding protein [Clostridia bacterium]